MRNLTNAIALIKKFEGCYLTAYQDPSPRKIWTIGYGRTEGVTKGMKQTKAEAEADLMKDLEKRAKALEKLLTVKQNDNQFGALLSFAYNLGLGFLKRSELLKAINLSGDAKYITDLFLHYNHAGGKVLNGLTRRRLAEANLYRSKV